MSRPNSNRDRHSVLALFTPADVFLVRVAGRAATGQLALDAAYVDHPVRFACEPPVVRLPHSKVASDRIDRGRTDQTAADVLSAATTCGAHQRRAATTDLGSTEGRSADCFSRELRAQALPATEPRARRH
jgi:hypothetical protein